jgi:hypothetical protein
MQVSFMNQKATPLTDFDSKPVRERQRVRVREREIESE